MSRKIVFVLPSLRIGGAEKFVVNLANYLEKKNDLDITLIHLVSMRSEKEYEISKGINQVYFNSSSTMLSMPKLLSYVRSEKPDVVFSTLVHVNFLIAFLCLFFPRKTTTVIREAAVISHYLAEKNNLFLKILYKLVYLFPTYVVCQSKDMQDDLINNFNLCISKSHVINNPISFSYEVLSNSESNKSRVNEKKNIRLLFVGRLTFQKNVSFLLDVVKFLPSNYFLDVVGNGNLYDDLILKVNNDGLSDRVFFHGFQQDIDYYYKRSDCLLLTSHYEGFPNVLLEALSKGVPVVCSNFPGGANDIIENTGGGIIISSNCAKEFSEQLQNIDFSQVAKKINLRMYSENFIYSKYLKILINHEKK